MLVTAHCHRPQCLLTIFPSAISSPADPLPTGLSEQRVHSACQPPGLRAVSQPCSVFFKVKGSRFDTTMIRAPAAGFVTLRLGRRRPHTCACASQGGRKPEVRRSVRRTGPRRARSLELTRSVLQEHGFSRSASSSAGFNSRLQSVAFQVRLVPEEAALDLGAPAIRGQRPTLSVKRIFRPIPAQRPQRAARAAAVRASSQNVSAFRA